MNTFREIDEKILALVDEDGEIMDLQAFEQLQMDRAAKIENVACWVKNLRAEADAITNEAKSLQERAKSQKNKADRLESYLEAALHGEKFSTARVAISWRKSKAVMIEDEAEFLRKHPEYARIKTEIDKAAVKDELKKGAEISGAVLEERLNMTIK